MGDTMPMVPCFDESNVLNWLNVLNCSPGDFCEPPAFDMTSRDRRDRGRGCDAPTTASMLLTISSKDGRSAGEARQHDVARSTMLFGMWPPFLAPSFSSVSSGEFCGHEGRGKGSEQKEG